MLKGLANTIRGCGVFVLMMLSALSYNVSAQVLGTATNYSGSRGLAVNPSLMTTSYVYADFGLNLGISAYNDFAYLHAKDLFSLIYNGTLSDYHVNGRTYSMGFVMNKNPKYVYENLDFNVISMMLCPKGKRAYGIFVNNRVYTSGKRIPWEIPEAAIVSIEEGDYLGKNYKSENAKIGLMAWSEVGLSYSMTVYDRHSDKFDVGMTAKGLLGYVGVALNLDDVDKDIVDKNVSVIHKLNMTADMAGPIDYEAQFADGQLFDKNRLINGLGLGFDIGVTYTNKKDEKEHGEVKRPCTFPKIQYNWRLGVSLLDVGAIRFNKNTRTYRYFSEEDKVFDISRLEGVVNFDSMMDTLNSIFYENPAEARGGDGFVMGLPTALSVQFDYNIWRGFYVNSTWVQPLRFWNYTASRPAMLIVSPRYESSFFDVSAHVSLYNYEKIILGAEVRLAFLSVGTHNIFNFIGLGESYGLDVYAAVKFNLNKGKCWKKVIKDSCWNANFK